MSEDKKAKRRAYIAAYRATNPEYKEKRRAYMKEYRAANPEYKKKDRAAGVAYYAAHRTSNLGVYMWRSARDRAKAKNIPFAIAPSDIAIPSTCPIFGVPLERGRGKPGPNSPSLDRIVPARGYVPGNVIVVSHRANAIKQNATPEEIALVAAFYQQIWNKSMEPKP